MKYKISKELFEAVYNEELANIEIGIHSVVAYIIDGTEFTEDINDFFFKCKEWALKQGYGLESCSTPNNRFYCNCKHKQFEANSEQQAVFDACEWILDNKDR